MVFYFIFNFIYFVVVLDIDKKYDVKCNMKKQFILRKICDNLSNGGLRREFLLRNEIFVLEKISLDYEYVDRIYCDSIK